MSLNEIIQTRSQNLEKLIFEIEQSPEYTDEEGFSRIDRSKIKQHVQIKVNQIEEDGEKQLI